jgi:hypothetical protein
MLVLGRAITAQVTAKPQTVIRNWLEVTDMDPDQEELFRCKILNMI